MAHGAQLVIRALKCPVDIEITNNYCARLAHIEGLVNIAIAVVVKPVADLEVADEVFDDCLDAWVEAEADVGDASGAGPGAAKKDHPQELQKSFQGGAKSFLRHLTPGNCFECCSRVRKTE